MSARTDALAAIADLLSSAFSEKELETPFLKEFSHHGASLEREFRVHLPCLTLDHEKEEGISDGYSNRKHAEERAVCLLARPLQEQEEEGSTPSTRIARSARSLLHNVYHSFAVLVDSRLHAYTNFLASHALSQSAKIGDNFADDFHNERRAVRGIEEKIVMMLATGAHVAAGALAARFEVTQDEGSTVQEGSKFSSKIGFVVAMDFGVPRHNGKNEVVTIAFSTTGTITGTFSPESHKMEAVEIKLDTRHLLNEMVQQAALVVSAVVEIASNACNNGKHQISRSASFLAMPPPSMPIHNKRGVLPPTFASFLKANINGSAGLDLLSKAAAELPVVSPDLSGTGPVWSVVQDFDLEADDEDVTNLSFDQCADIIDTCLFGGDFDDVSERPSKRTKIDGF